MGGLTSASDAVAERRRTCRRPPDLPCLAKGRRGICPFCNSARAHSERLHELSANSNFARLDAERIQEPGLQPESAEDHSRACVRPWSDEDTELLKKLRSNHVGIAKCAAQLGRSETTVRKHMRRLGLPTPGWSTESLNTIHRARQLEAVTIKWTEEMDEILRKMRERGASLDACAHQLRISDGTIRKRLDFLGLPRRLPRY